MDKLRAELKAAHPEVKFTTDYEGADMAILYLNPFTGDYFKATGLLDLNIHEATNVNLAKIQAIRAAVPQVVMSVNFMLPWRLGHVEPLADALLGGFETHETATLDVICGQVRPVGTMPITLPGSDAAIAVDEHDLCASPTDVPGYDKEKYMGGRTYDYVDTEGNKYRLGFGLHF